MALIRSTTAPTTKADPDSRPKQHSHATETALANPLTANAKRQVTGCLRSPTLAGHSCATPAAVQELEEHVHGIPTSMLHAPFRALLPGNLVTRSLTLGRAPRDDKRNLAVTTGEPPRQQRQCKVEGPDAENLLTRMLGAVCHPQEGSAVAPQQRPWEDHGAGPSPRSSRILRSNFWRCSTRTPRSWHASSDKSSRTSPSTFSF